MEITPGELKKLAEIAGVRITIFSNVLYYHLDGKPIVISTEFIWQPHLRIEQAMMVAENAFGWFAAKRERPNGEWEYTFQGAHKTEHGVIDFMGVGASLSEAICRAALAAKEG